jgi:hypothetical protein
MSSKEHIFTELWRFITFDFLLSFGFYASIFKRNFIFIGDVKATIVRKCLVVLCLTTCHEMNTYGEV